MLTPLRSFDRRFRVYDISDFGETIRTYKRTEHDEILAVACWASHRRLHGVESPTSDTEDMVPMEAEHRFIVRLRALY